uniref:Uncharacterized protein n=1 Tax=Arundo donax TaxID=35708 RepID=A0A0A8Z7H0_ARUDO
MYMEATFIVKKIVAVAASAFKLVLVMLN